MFNTGMTVATTAAVLFGPGTLKEKIQALAVGYALSWGTEYIAGQVIGGRFVGAGLGFTLGIVIGMCSDNASQCERQERAKARAEAEEALENEILQRTEILYFQELGKGNTPDWNIVQNMVLQEKYVELGLDKIDEARRPRDPSKCYKDDRYYEAGSLTAPRIYNNAPTMQPYYGPR
jgi:hypothetical protein